jgi:allantoinase
MSDFDLVLRRGNVVLADKVLKADIGVVDGAIAAVQPELSGSCRDELNAEDLHVFPGLVDAHLHFNEPGRTEWEGFETGSRALAAGGGTMFFDMPLNAHPPTIDADSFDQKLAAASNNSILDFAFWGGLVPGNLDELEPLAERGVIGFKAFMCNSGIEDFEAVDFRILREGMKRSARIGLPVAVHAESEKMTRQLTEERQTSGRTSIRDFLDSRPVEAELEAIRVATDIAGETGCRLHIVHVSCGDGISLIAQAKKSGVDVSCETCPHYLALTDQDMLKLGPVAKCAPPLRSRSQQERLWEHLLAGDIDTVGSDHSPSPPSMKRNDNFFKVWGGISGVQHTLQLLLTEAHFNRQVSLPLVAGLISSRVAKRFKLPSTKGQIAVGNDADLSLVDLEHTFNVRTEDLFYRHVQTPYAGRKLRGKVVHTLLRGQSVFRDGKFGPKRVGRLIKPLP